MDLHGISEVACGIPASPPWFRKSQRNHDLATTYLAWFNELRTWIELQERMFLSTLPCSVRHIFDLGMMSGQSSSDASARFGHRFLVSFIPVWRIPGYGRFSVPFE